MHEIPWIRLKFWYPSVTRSWICESDAQQTLSYRRGLDYQSRLWMWVLNTTFLPPHRWDCSLFCSLLYFQARNLSKVLCALSKKRAVKVGGEALLQASSADQYLNTFREFITVFKCFSQHVCNHLFKYLCIVFKYISKYFPSYSNQFNWIFCLKYIIHF